MASASADGGLTAEVLRLHGHSAQPESVQVVAVLSAMTEVVKGEQLAVTPTSLFAAAMSALEKPETQLAPQVRCAGRPHTVAAWG
jgi:ribosomal RNA-processing protein 12